MIQQQFERSQKSPGNVKAKSETDNIINYPCDFWVAEIGMPEFPWCWNQDKHDVQQKSNNECLPLWMHVMVFLSFSVSVHRNTGYKQKVQSKIISLLRRKSFHFPRCISDKTFSIRKVFIVSLSTIPSVFESAVFPFFRKCFTM